MMGTAVAGRCRVCAMEWHLTLVEGRERYVCPRCGGILQMQRPEDQNWFSGLSKSGHAIAFRLDAVGLVEPHRRSVYAEGHAHALESETWERFRSEMEWVGRPVPDVPEADPYLAFPAGQVV